MTLRRKNLWRMYGIKVSTGESIFRFGAYKQRRMEYGCNESGFDRRAVGSHSVIGCAYGNCGDQYDVRHRKNNSGKRGQL